MGIYFPLLISPLIGSFLGVLIRRIPAGRPVAWARSQCESCGAVLAARDLVPLLSFAWSRGRCRLCHHTIDVFHPAVELAAMAVAAWAALQSGDDLPRLWFDCALGWTLLALGWIDWEHLILPDALTLPLIPLGLLATAWTEPPDATLDHAAAAIAGYLVFLAVAAAYRLLRDRDGLGEGDAKLLAAGGAWLGLGGLAPLVLLGAIVGLSLAGVQALRGRPVSATTALPFGTSLAFGLWLLRLYG